MKIKSHFRSCDSKEKIFFHGWKKKFPILIYLKLPNKTGDAKKNISSQVREDILII